MFTITPISHAITMAPFVSLGRQPVSQESADLKSSSFAPTEQPVETLKVINQRAPHERRNNEAERDRLTLLPFKPPVNHPTAELIGRDVTGGLTEDESSVRNFLEVNELSQLSLLAHKALSKDDLGLSNERPQSHTSFMEEANIAPFQKDTEQRRVQLQADDVVAAKAHRIRRELMSLVDEPSIQLHQRLMEITLSSGELNVGEIVNSRV